MADALKEQLFAILQKLQSDSYVISTLLKKDNQYRADSLPQWAILHTKLHNPELLCQTYSEKNEWQQLFNHREGLQKIHFEQSISIQAMQDNDDSICDVVWK